MIQKTQAQKIYDKTLIAKLVREQLKKEFPAIKFSVTSDRYLIQITAMKGQKLTRSYEELSESAIYNYTEYLSCRTKEELKQLANSEHCQLGNIRDEWVEDIWSNGTFLTKEAHEMFKRITEITDQWNWDNSDIQTDCFDVNFYLNLGIGKYDKDYVVEKC